METKQTAVEWLEEEINKFNTVITKEFLLILIEQAKQIEKEQIINAFIGNDSDTDENLEVAEQYYTETYGKDTITK